MSNLSLVPASTLAPDTARFGLLMLLASGILISACETPDRISREMLISMEEERRVASDEAGPKDVRPEQIGLTDTKPYRIQVNDELVLTMTGLQADQYAPVEMVVRVHAGEMDQVPQISLPVVGVVVLGTTNEGMTLGEVEQAILTAHRTIVADQAMSVHARLFGSSDTTVLVFGAAAQPGLIRLRSNERNPLYAVASAGGFQGISSGVVRVKPAQPQREEMVYDFNDINDIRRALLAPPLQTGDTVIVEAGEESAIYVTGLIQRPGPILMPDHSELSVLRAIAAAGGIREYIQVEEATLTRRLSDGEQVMVELNLGEMLAGKAADLALHPGDVLHIPHTVDTVLQQWAIQNILIGPFQLRLSYDPLAQYNAERALRQDNDISLGDAIRSSLGSSIPSIVVPPVTTP